MGGKHALFAPSAAHRWMACPGSMAFQENWGENEDDSSVYADDGTASHGWCAEIIDNGNVFQPELGDTKAINGREYVWDEDRARFCNVYIDDVMQRAMGGSLYNDYRVDLSHILGEEQGGTLDNAIYQPLHLTAVDLKYGMGEKVYAKYEHREVRGGELVVEYQINPQLGLYLLGVLKDMELMDRPVEKVTAVIAQPRLGHLDEHTISVEELREFGKAATAAVAKCGEAMILPPDSPELDKYLNPGDKTCRWCKAKARCYKLAAFVSDQVKSDFDDIEANGVAPPPIDLGKLGVAFRATNLVDQWVKAIRTATWKAVNDGKEVIGVDGKPLKFVEGKKGDRKWADPVRAEAALAGLLPEDKVYLPRTIIGVTAADKLLNRKATKQQWLDVFNNEADPLISRAPGKAKLALGSDPKPPFNNTATADDFDEIGVDNE